MSPHPEVKGIVSVRVSVRTSEKVLVDEVRQPESNTSKDEASLYDVLRSSGVDAVYSRATVEARPKLQGDATGFCVDSTANTTGFTTSCTGHTTGCTTTHTTESTTENTKKVSSLS